MAHLGSDAGSGNSAGVMARRSRSGPWSHHSGKICNLQHVHGDADLAHHCSGMGHQHHPARYCIGGPSEPDICREAGDYRPRRPPRNRPWPHSRRDRISRSQFQLQRHSCSQERESAHSSGNQLGGGGAHGCGKIYAGESYAPHLRCCAGNGSGGRPPHSGISAGGAATQHRIRAAGNISFQRQHPRQYRLRRRRCLHQRCPHRCRSRQHRRGHRGISRAIRNRGG